MVRSKKRSEVIIQAQRRLAGMKSINEQLDLGNGCSTATIEAKLDETRSKLELYNKILAQASAAINDFERSEKELAGLSKKVLLGAAMQFDQESDEYEMVGGIRPSDRKRAKRPAATTQPSLPEIRLD
jgi:hypothetical protein